MGSRCSNVGSTSQILPTVQKEKSTPHLAASSGVSRETFTNAPKEKQRSRVLMENLLGQIAFLRSPQSQGGAVRSFIVVYQSENELGLVSSLGAILSTESITVPTQGPDAWAVMGHYIDDHYVSQVVLDINGMLSDPESILTDVGRDSLRISREAIVDAIERRIRTTIQDTRDADDSRLDEHFRMLRGEQAAPVTANMDEGGVRIVVTGNNPDEVRDILGTIAQALNDKEEDRLDDLGQ